MLKSLIKSFAQFCIHIPEYVGTLITILGCIAIAAANILAWFFIPWALALVINFITALMILPAWAEGYLQNH